MIDRYSNYYEARSASRERSAQKMRDENKENTQANRQQELSANRLVTKLNVQHNVEESLGLRDPVQLLEQDLTGSQESLQPAIISRSNMKSEQGDSSRYQGHSDRLL
jgi:hypothetical protein